MNTSVTYLLSNTSWTCLCAATHSSFYSSVTVSYSIYHLLMAAFSFHLTSKVGRRQPWIVYIFFFIFRTSVTPWPKDQNHCSWSHFSAMICFVRQGTLERIQLLWGTDLHSELMNWVICCKECWFKKCTWVHLCGLLEVELRHHHHHGWHDYPKENSTSKPSLLVTVPLTRNPAGAEVYPRSTCHECHRYVLSHLFLSWGGVKSQLFCQHLIGTRQGTNC